MREPIRSFFVYGTLKRGHCRESCWPAQPLSIASASVKGQLFDLGPYPAMTLGEDVVVGELWTFADKDVPVVAQVLDEVEGFNQPGEEDLYLRMVVEWTSPCEPTRHGIAYTYVYGPIATLTTQQRIDPVDGNVVQWPRMS